MVKRESGLDSGSAVHNCWAALAEQRDKLLGLLWLPVNSLTCQHMAGGKGRLS
jgi:hypothetical protein